MSQPKKYSPYVSFGLHILGLLLCILPPTVCTLSYFPFWESYGLAHCLAGGGALVLVICAMPMLKLLKRIEGISSYVVWLILFLIFLALSKIAEQMTVISLVGFVGNLLGAICFHLAKRERREVNYE